METRVRGFLGCVVHGFTHKYAERYVERFTVTPCSEKLVTGHNNVSLRIREDLGPGFSIPVRPGILRNTKGGMGGGEGRGVQLLVTSLVTGLSGNQSRGMGGREERGEGRRGGGGSY